MSAALELLDKALDSAREELRLLRKGDEQGALQLARIRDLMVRESWEQREPSEEAAMLRALKQLRTLHEGITGEARKRRDKVRDDLRALRGRRKRNAAYGAARRGAPASAGVSRFVDRKS